VAVVVLGGVYVNIFTELIDTIHRVVVDTFNGGMLVFPSLFLGIIQKLSIYLRFCKVIFWDTYEFGMLEVHCKIKYWEQLGIMLLGEIVFHGYVVFAG
jgi:hypothetical protein